MNVLIKTLFVEATVLPLVCFFNFPSSLTLLIVPTPILGRGTLYTDGISVQTILTG